MDRRTHSIKGGLAETKETYSRSYTYRSLFAV